MDFQDALISSLKGNGQRAVALLAGLHARGALDLDETGVLGTTLIQRLIKEEPLTHEMVAFLNQMGRSDIYTTAPPEGKPIIDIQAEWISSGYNKTGYGIPIASSTMALAAMIGEVDPSWWLAKDHPGDDPGARIIRESCLGPLNSLVLSALWKRGISPHARLSSPGRPLACLEMSGAPYLGAYLEAGGDPCIEPFQDTPTKQVFWEHLLLRHPGQHEHFASFAQKGLIDAETLGFIGHQEEIHLLSLNRSAMIAKIAERPSWNQEAMPDGTPVWLHYLGWRPDLIGYFTHLKKKKPDFTQRDEEGRSAWFRLGTKIQDINAFIALNKVLPWQEYAKDAHGGGLVSQLLKEGFRARSFSALERLDLMAKNLPDDDVLFAGIQNVDTSDAYSKYHSREGDHDKLAPLVDATLLMKISPKQRGDILAGAIKGGQSSTMNTRFKHLLWNLKLLRQYPIEWPTLPPRIEQKFSEIGKYLGVNANLTEWENLLERWKTESCAQEIAADTATSEKIVAARPRI